MRKVREAGGPEKSGGYNGRSRHHERLWRSLKYEHVYLHAYESVGEARRKIRCLYLTEISYGSGVGCRVSQDSDLTTGWQDCLRS